MLYLGATSQCDFNFNTPVLCAGYRTRFLKATYGGICIHSHLGCSNEKQLLGCWLVPIHIVDVVLLFDSSEGLFLNSPTYSTTCTFLRKKPFSSY